MLADLQKIHATSKHWRDLEEEWKRENAGCCDGCGRQYVGLLQGACPFCYPSFGYDVSRDALRSGGHRAPNAAWKRHDREILQATPEDFSRRCFAEFNDITAAFLQRPLPRHPDWPKET